MAYDGFWRIKILSIEYFLSYGTWIEFILRLFSKIKCFIVASLWNILYLSKPYWNDALLQFDNFKFVEGWTSQTRKDVRENNLHDWSVAFRDHECESKNISNEKTTDLHFFIILKILPRTYFECRNSRNGWKFGW